MKENTFRKFIGILSMIFLFLDLLLFIVFGFTSLSDLIIIFFLPTLIISAYMLLTKRKDKILGVILLLYGVFSFLMLFSLLAYYSLPLSLFPPPKVNNSEIVTQSNIIEIGKIITPPVGIISVFVIGLLCFVSSFYIFGLIFKKKTVA